MCWIDVCGMVALTGDTAHCEQYVEELQRHYEIEAYAPQPGQVAAIITDVTEKRQAEAMRRGYTRHMIELEEELRRKLATELHDEIGRDLSVIGINLSLLGTRLSREPEELRSRLTDSEELLKGVSRTVRTMMGMLRPPVLDDYGLPAALRWHGDLVAKRFDLAVSVQVEDEFPRMSAGHELTLFRITQEALANVARHADATEVTVSLCRGNGKIALAVSDNGKGFVPQRNTVAGSGWGVTIMRERAELAGGSFHLESATETGTRISVTLPEKT
jgi:signal transduction histidine kinase